MLITDSTDADIVRLEARASAVARQPSELRTRYP
jgi:hypothetical protein